MKLRLSSRMHYMPEPQSVPNVGTRAPLKENTASLCVKVLIFRFDLAHWNYLISHGEVMAAVQ